MVLRVVSGGCEWWLCCGFGVWSCKSFLWDGVGEGTYFGGFFSGSRVIFVAGLLSRNEDGGWYDAVRANMQEERMGSNSRCIALVMIFRIALSYL